MREPLSTFDPHVTEASLRRIAVACAAATVLIAVLVLIGWALDLRVLKSILPSYITMKANTAVGLGCLGGALILQARAHGVAAGAVSRTLALIAGLIAIATLAEYLAGVDLHIDELLFADPEGRSGHFPPGRLAPITATTFLLLALAIWTMGPSRPQADLLSQAATFVALLAATQALVGYAAGVTYSFGAAFYTQIALHTALALVLLCIALLCLRPHVGAMAVFLAATAGGAMARRLIVWAVLVPPLINALQLLGQRRGWYDADFGTLLRVLGNVVFFSLLVWRSANQLHGLDLRERKRLELARRETFELEERNRRIQEANRLKSEFLANMSHELRTPLNAIIGFTQAVHDDEHVIGQAQRREFLGYVLTSAKHLLQLINDVLDLAKVESGKMEFHHEAVDLTKLVDEVRDVLRTLAARKRIEIQSQIDPAISQVVIDPGKLKQVLYNYLSNALKFTPDEGRVVVRAMPEGEDAFRLEVDDTGPGIRDEDLGLLFVEFKQLEATLTKKHEGTGLGLALTRRIVEAQGGRVGVKSQIGRGSLFFAVLPRKPKEAPIPAAEEARRPAVAGAPTVLVVEDDEKERIWLSETLTAAGYAVEIAATGESAIALCRARSFEAITLDLLLPDMSGWDVLRAARAEGANRATPIMVVSVVPEKATGAGFIIQDYLIKPVRVEELIGALERAGVPADGIQSVLVVDDDPVIIRLIQSSLRGYRLVFASDGEKGLQAAAAERPAAVVLDLMMPKMDGFEFLRRFRRTEGGQHTPVIVWSTKDLSDDERRQLVPSVQAVLLKTPGSAEALIAELRTFVPPAKS
jgi:signal transduction histidine kinase/CheY-like chemotaxis protein